MRREIMWWLDDHAGTLFGVLFFVVGIAFLVFLLHLIEIDKSQKCDKLMAFARTHADSMAVMLKCDAPSETPTTVVVPVYTR